MTEEISRKLIDRILEGLGKNYLGPIYSYLENHPEFVETVTGFLVNPEKIICYIGKTHIGIEYLGPERLEKLEYHRKSQVQFFDFTLKEGNFFEQVIGFKFDDSSSLRSFPLPSFTENLYLPTNAGYNKLLKLGWNFDAQDMLLGFNFPSLVIPEYQFSRIVNGFFFDADEKGLKTRHIKWIDFIPIYFKDIDEKYASISVNLDFYKDFVQHDVNYVYPIPDEYKYKKLQIINRFIELISNSETTEPEITYFLSQETNKFILTMKFGAKEVYSELVCKWQSEKRDDVRPDFFILQPSGYADIIEFKLPNIKNKPIVGRSNRATFSSEINSYISQTRVYNVYFDDPNNRKWFERNYEFKVHKPRRYLVIGRRRDFSFDQWREIVSDFSNIELITYDDVIDGVVAQFYL